MTPTHCIQNPNTVTHNMPVGRLGIGIATEGGVMEVVRVCLDDIRLLETDKMNRDRLGGGETLSSQEILDYYRLPGAPEDIRKEIAARASELWLDAESGFYAMARIEDMLPIH